MFKVICLLCSFIYFVSAKEIKFENCGGNITRVTVTPCDDEPCRAKRGTSLKITADIISNQNSEKLSLWIGAILGTIELPLPGLDKDACSNKGLTCPIRIGDKQTFSIDLNILKMFPLVNVTALFDVTGDTEEKLFCFKAPVKVIAN